MTAQDVTEAMKALDIKLAHEGSEPETLASSHLGLGIVMLCELHYPLDELVMLVRKIGEEHVPN